MNGPGVDVRTVKRVISADLWAMEEANDPDFPFAEF